MKRVGEEVLENLVNREKIADYCRRHHVEVTNQEVEDEIERMAAKFKIPKNQWLKLLETERKITHKQYAEDITWPSLALRKLAEPQLTLTKEEMDKAYESQFGRGVKARMIILDRPDEAEKVRAQAASNPRDFAALARRTSVDSATASAGGLIQPIRRYVGDKNIEKVAFSMTEGEISPVIRVNNQFVIIKCEGFVPPANVDRRKVDYILEDALKEGKMHAAARDVFEKLDKQSVVQIVFGDPEKQKQMPGVAAVVNGHQISMRQLGEACIDRHGEEVLEKLLDQKLLEQALRGKNLKVTQADLDSEVARAALAMGQRKPNGAADVDAWLRLISKQQTVDVYMSDAVWPSVALKKIIGDNVIITEEDIKKGYEANYGPRVRCRAIMLSNQRKAQEVWEKARDNPTAENFAHLAKEYSIDGNSGSLGGEVPPIQRHGGQPTLEKEAFALTAEEPLSGIIQMDENFVILYFQGLTKPQNIPLAEARKLIQEDLHEKKVRIAMREEFQRLQDNSEVDNFLSGTIRTKKVPASVATKSSGPSRPKRR